MRARTLCLLSMALSYACSPNTSTSPTGPSSFGGASGSISPSGGATATGGGPFVGTIAGNSGSFAGSVTAFGGAFAAQGGSTAGTNTQNTSTSGTSTGGFSTSSGGAGGGPSSSGVGSAPGTATGGTSATATTSVGPGSYSLGPPNQCYNHFAIQGCRKGVATSECGGVCTNDYGAAAANACESGKTGVPINFACPRFLLYSDEFNQAAIDDGNTEFNYGIVGHDVDTSGVDSGLMEACCQCYQIVFDYPKENQVWQDPNATANPVSAVPPPKAMIVQSFNTGTAGPGNFDIYMGAGGLGAHNGCFSVNGSVSPSGLYQYTGYPAAGQPNDGGVKPAGNWGNGTACKTSLSWVTEATIGSPGCVEKVTAACNEIMAVDPAQQAAARRSCILSNSVQSLYHLNWHFWVRRVECPAHLTEVTGCKLAPQGLPPPDPKVTTVPLAKAAGFRQLDGSGQRYFTTTMEDCCMPTCAWANNVKGTAVGLYNSFYSCNQGGIPQTQ